MAAMPLILNNSESQSIAAMAAPTTPWQSPALSARRGIEN